MVSVNENAPVLGKAKIEINADQDTVWDVMANVEAWPKWNPDVNEAILYGELKPGTHFQWEAGLGKCDCVIQNVEPTHLLAWTGKMMGVNAIHVCKIDFIDGKTIVETDESWDGLVSSGMHDKMQETLEELLHSCLNYLKAEVERNPSP